MTKITIMTKFKPFFPTGNERASSCNIGMQTVHITNKPYSVSFRGSLTEVLTSGRRSYTPLISTAPEAKKEEMLTVKEQEFADCTLANFTETPYQSKNKYQYIYS